MYDWLRDTHHAIRGLCRQPAYSLVAILTLGIAFGAVCAIGTLVFQILLRPLPYEHAERLAVIEHSARGAGIERAGVSEGTYLHYREFSRTLDAVGAYSELVVNVTDGGDPERVSIASVSSSIFQMLAVRALHGRLLTAEDERRGASVVVVLCYDFWVRRYGANPAVVGRMIELNQLPREVVGILPPGFAFPRPETSIWFPLDEPRRRLTALSLNGIARLRPGVSVAGAQTELTHLVSTLSATTGDTSADWVRRTQLRPVVTGLHEHLISDVRLPLWLLFGTVAFVLVVAWANVANLTLIRGEQRRKDVAIQRALGATSARLVRATLCETTLLTTAAACCGLAVSYVALRLGLRMTADPVPRLHEIQFDAVTVAVAVVLAGCTIALLTAIALWQTMPAQGTAALRTRSKTAPGQLRVQRSLVIVEVALALALLVGSAVTVQSYARLRQVALGFAPQHVTTIRLTLPSLPYPTFQAAARLFEQLTQRIRALPGVTAVGAANTVPLTAVLPGYRRTVEPTVLDRGSVPLSISAATTLATPGYFEAMGMSIAHGRTFQSGDLRADPHPVLISAEAGRQLFGDGDPIGRQIRLPDRPKLPTYTVVGMVTDVLGDQLSLARAPVLYFPLLDDNADVVMSPLDPTDVIVVVRSNAPSPTIGSSVRRIVREIDPKLPIAAIRPMDAIVDDASARSRFVAALLLLAACTAVLLGIVGLYGVITYAMSQRTHEMGVRLALGANGVDLHRMVVIQNLRSVLVGVSLGVGFALVAGRWLESVAFEISAYDPMTIGVMSLLLLTIAVAASYTAARRAIRVDPSTALRSE